MRLDLRHVTFMDSTGINALVVMDRRSKQRGMPFVLSAPITGRTPVLHTTPGAEAVLNVDDQPAA